MARACACLVVALIAVPALATRSATSPVAKVVQLIDDMAAKVAADQKAETQAFELFAKSCDDEATDKEHAIGDSKEQIAEYSAAIEEGKALISGFEEEIQELTSQISANEGEGKAASGARAKESEEFTATEKELADTVGTLSKAQAALKKKAAAKGEAFLQAEDLAQVQKVVRGLQLVVESSAISHAQQGKLQAFVQEKENEDDDDELSVQEPEKPTGSGILDTIADMLDKAEEQLSEARKAEMEAQHEYVMMMQGLQNQITSLKADLAETSQKKQVALESLAQNEKDLATETDSLKETDRLLSLLKRDCQEKAGDYEVESKDSAAELGALAKAKAIMTKKFGSASLAQEDDQSQDGAAFDFLQVSSKTRSKASLRAHARAGSKGFLTLDSDQADTTKAQALRLIQNLGRRVHSSALVSLALRAADDPFAKVRSMVEEMIAKLVAEAAEEADQKAFCDKEIGESKTSQGSKSQKLDELTARMDRLSASQAQLTEEVAKLTTELSQIDTTVQENTAIRAQSKAAFDVAAKDFSESQEACANAIEVLREYYDNAASFVQVSMKTRLRSRATLASGSEGGEGILALLETAESDFATMLAEARATEQRDVDEFNKMMQENKVLKAVKSAEIKGKETELKSIRTSLDEYGQDKEGLTTELDAVNEYLNKLKPQCETKVPSYAEKKAARDQEIEGLKSALELLAGGI